MKHLKTMQNTFKLLVMLSFIGVFATGCFQPAAEPLPPTVGGSTQAPLPSTATSSGASPDMGGEDQAQPTLHPIAGTTTALAATMTATGVGVPTRAATTTPTIDPNAPTLDPSVPTLLPTPTGVGDGGAVEERDTSPAVPTPTSPPVADGCTHILQRGENLFRLALAWETTVEAIAQLNGITNPDTVAAGTVLRRPNCGTNQVPVESDASPGGGTIYVVKVGDTLYSIATRFGVTMQAIMDANPAVQANPDQLSVGQQIVIP